MTSRRMSWAKHLVLMEVILKPEGKRPLERLRRCWKDNNIMDLREIGRDGVCSSRRAILHGDNKLVS
jgi:hypothetical protein